MTSNYIMNLQADIDRAYEDMESELDSLLPIGSKVIVRSGRGKVRLRGTVKFKARRCNVLIESASGNVHYCHYRKVHEAEAVK